MPYVITEACIDVKDGTCVDVCPVDCIKTTPDEPMFYIDPNACIDCNACRHVCPVDAIYSTYEIPEGQEQYEAINADFFRAKPA
jgi:NAD-dependent dihydropyrimidine dehydrogenase PreA subunit